jgi:hypothetical protein
MVQSVAESVADSNSASRQLALSDFGAPGGHDEQCAQPGHECTGERDNFAWRAPHPGGDNCKQGLRSIWQSCSVRVT